MKPEISIIVPVYNVENYIKDCIDSILGQTFSNFEVILINDGSTDRSGSVCDFYAQKDKRVRVVHQDYSGVSSARNVGVNISQGDYIGFVDGDDHIAHDMYKNLLSLCKNSSSDIAVCKLGREIDGKLINQGEKGFIKEMDNTEGMRELFKGILYRFSLCNKLFKKNCFESIKFPEGRIHEDLSTTYKLFAKSKKIVYTNYIGYIYVKRSNSILTKKFNEKRLEAFIGWDEILEFMNIHYPHLSNEFIPCFVYSCIDNVYYILNQVENKKEKERYLLNIQHYVKKHYKSIIVCKKYNAKYKYQIMLLHYNIGLLLFTERIKSYTRKA
jgi:glycosyltransferase involved in cell wall biosynthesis